MGQETARPRARLAPLKRSWLLAGCAATLLGAVVPEPAQRPDEGAWDRLLARYVQSGRVDYAGLKEERRILEAYLVSLREVDVARLPTREAQLAFWINAYNACVIEGVLNHYPLRSVKDIRGFFDAIRYRVAGHDRTLNEIEAQGRALGDARIHFALVCASSSCPSLRSEAYLPDQLEAQLSEQAARFLRDPQRGLRVEGNVLWAPMIFKWYAKDFVAGRLTPATLLSAVRDHLPQEVRRRNTERLQLKWIDYDWTLNDLNIRRQL